MERKQRKPKSDQSKNGNSDDDDEDDEDDEDSDWNDEDEREREEHSSIRCADEDSGSFDSYPSSNTFSSISSPCRVAPKSSPAKSVASTVDAQTMSTTSTAAAMSTLDSGSQPSSVIFSPSDSLFSLSKCCSCPCHAHHAQYISSAPASLDAQHQLVAPTSLPGDVAPSSLTLVRRYERADSSSTTLVDASAQTISTGDIVVTTVYFDEN